MLYWIYFSRLTLYTISTMTPLTVNRTNTSLRTVMAILKCWKCEIRTIWQAIGFFALVYPHYVKSLSDILKYLHSFTLCIKIYVQTLKHKRLDYTEFFCLSHNIARGEKEIKKIYWKISDISESNTRNGLQNIKNVETKQQLLLNWSHIK